MNRDQLVRFGLIGTGHSLYFEVNGGAFKVSGRMIELVYKHQDKEYFLTGQQQRYQDIITYKDVEFTFDPSGAEGNGQNHILQYNFGYKNELMINGIRFNLQAICKIPMDGRPMYFNFKLVADTSLDGQLEIRRNGITVDSINAPLSKNKGGEMNWILQ
ncbi:hypothetical protein EDM21_14890 [Paenibacillus sp. N10]|uniref:Uncharacterized protein n=1 Tax=Paenibacillus lutrae TaxID=2078573 RepID=A0A7X3FJH5_9BACL|nr:hypothetical protein [Paenibacillus lutrae]